jgi:hypothetical protein
MGGKKQMLKDKLATVLVVLTFALAFAPAASQAAPLGLPHYQDMEEVTVFEQIVQLWDRLSGHAFGRAPAPRAANLPKNGCGIDPNGAPTPCPKPDPGAQSTTPPDGGDGSGS